MRREEGDGLDAICRSGFCSIFASFGLGLRTKWSKRGEMRSLMFLFLASVFCVGFVVGARKWEGESVDGRRGD